ncbi:MAG: diacylglycerol kinase family protein [Anaerolineae bacterium]|nr:diacylglycerol kinase family protein [Anaerolineae bacterium]
MTRWESFRCALAGVVYVLRTQRNAHIELIATAVVIAVGLWLQVTRLEWVLLAAMIGLVFTAEMINTAVECVVDLVTLEHLPLARIAKDVAAGGVLVTILASCIVGLLIFGPRLWAMIGQ